MLGVAIASTPEERIFLWPVEGPPHALQLTFIKEHEVMP
jgi:hypothetical protein